MKELARQYLIRNLLLARVLDIVYTVLCRATKVSIVAQGVLSHLGAHLGIGRTDVLGCGTKGIHHPLAKETPALGISVPYPQAYGKGVCPLAGTHDRTIGSIMQGSKHLGLGGGMGFIVGKCLQAKAVLLCLAQYVHVKAFQRFVSRGIALEHALHGIIGIGHGGDDTGAVLVLILFLLLSPSVSIGYLLYAGIEIFVLGDVFGLIASTQYK